MIKLLSSFALVAAFAAAALSFILFAPLSRPAPLASIADAARAGTAAAPLAPLMRYRARDGAALAYRAYPAGAGAPIAILIHGSGGSSRDMNAMGAALAAAGVSAYAPDVRGQGESGTRGDIAYVGQQEDDLDDFIDALRADSPTAPITLVGHSSGGGFALKYGGGQGRDRIARLILLAPYLGHDAPTTRPNSGGWAKPNVARIVVLTVLRRFGFDGLAGLPVLAFAARPDAPGVTTQWSFRMMQGFAASAPFAQDVRGLKAPTLVIAGAADELMIAERYAPTFAALDPAIEVRLLSGVGHIALCSDAGAAALIAAAAAR